MVGHRDRSSQGFSVMEWTERIVGTFARELEADVLLLGWGLDDDNTHSPNEKFNLGDFHRGIKASAALWGELAKGSGKSEVGSGNG